MTQSIIDSHVHFWDPKVLQYSWLENEPKLDRAYLTDHVPPLANGWTVEGIVFVQADCAPEQGLAEADWVAELAARDARVRGIVAFAPLEQGAGVRPWLEALKTGPLVKGVRRLIQDEPAGFSIQPEFVAGVKLLPEYGLTCDLCIRHHQLGDLIQLVRQCPDVRFVLDHVGKPDIKGGVRDPWQSQLAELAGFPNVHCKLSGMLTEADHRQWTPEEIQPYIQHALAVFGSDRVMYGSDAPVLYLAGTYERWAETLADATAGLSTADKQKFWRDNAAAFYVLD
jgi:L-fuconolactonase